MRTLSNRDLGDECRPAGMRPRRDMKRVILETPYRGYVGTNLRFARACLRDCLLRGESPIAAHLLYTQDGVLDDGDPHDRALGIKAGLAWGPVANATVVYTDLGISEGMQRGIDNARDAGREIIMRSLTDPEP